ncbi:MAG TPA: RNA polymerase-binding protein DksA [Steroidobacteraceae bacterium]|nr:RNA polymerase-binding protein DksA [Steroidobacteraceae bacterium]
MPAKRAPARTKAKKTAPRKAAPVKASAQLKAKSRTKAHAAARPVPAKKAAPVKKPVTASPARAHAPAARPAAATAHRPAADLKLNRLRPATASFEPPTRLVPLPTDGEDNDLADTSLLAGPRNVQPYIAKRGEQYMSKEQLDHFRNILLTWKRDLMEEVDRTVLHMKDEAANFPDPNDRATQESEFSLELRTRDRERKLIRKIEEALMRIEDGSYGYCLETGEEIGIKRLEARPVATLCVEAQERRERRERQYGDRDDRYR